MMIKARDVVADGFFPDVDGVNAEGGFKTLIASGTFGGGSVELQCKYDGLTDWVPADPGDGSAKLSAPGALNATLKASTQYRLAVINTTAPNLNFGIQ